MKLVKNEYECNAFDIYDRAINKIPPFTENESDKGFKDAIIWDTVLCNAEKEKESIHILLSNDKGFCENEYKNKLV